MNIKKKSKRPEPHIPFISLADIAWQIIIFFLLVSTFAMSDSMNLDIPAASSKQPANGQASAKMLTVQATEAQVLLDGKPVPIDQLQAQVAKLLVGRKTEQEKAVIIQGKDDLSFQRNVDIMYAVQKAGGILVMEEEK